MVRYTSLTGRQGRSDRSCCWLVNRLDLLHFALRDHGPIFVEVFIPRLFCLLLPLLLVAKALDLPLLSMCQPLWTPTAPSALPPCSPPHTAAAAAGTPRGLEGSNTQPPATRPGGRPAIFNIFFRFLDYIVIYRSCRKFEKW